ncbi:MAG: aspartate aminotransferase family protein [Chloroflexi bacterium]|nr:aspartate aminotransferase family protein [Chloroflexota bacterium]
MHVVANNEIVFTSGDGILLTDTTGRQVLDATAALWYCNVGYGRREIANAVADQLTRLAAYSSFGAYTTDRSVELAERLAGLSPLGPETVVFLGSGGSDAIDTAAKLARRYWDVIGRPEKRVIVSREHAYHGMHAWGTSLVGIPGMKAGYGGPFIDEVAMVGAMDLDGLAALFEARAGEIAAFIGEPVIGAGGVIPPTDAYWPAVTALCHRYDVLLIADEVITGFGRTGELWASTRYRIEPDMITFAKGVSSGYVPLGGVLVGERVRRPFWDDPVPGAVLRHGYTYSGHAGAAAAALANLDIIESEGLVARVKAMEPFVASAFGRLAGQPLVGDIRTVGLTAAVAVDAEALAVDPALPERLVAAAYQHGVATRVLRGHALQFSPAFVITETQIDTIVSAFAASFDELAAGR